jgi:hypothetical protein
VGVETTSFSSFRDERLQAFGSLHAAAAAVGILQAVGVTPPVAASNAEAEVSEQYLWSGHGLDSKNGRT